MGYATLIIDDSAMIGITAPAPAPAVPQSPYRPFSQTMVSPAETLKQLYSRYVGALQGASDFLRDDLPSASPGVAKWAQETGRRACRKYARQRGSIPFLTSDPSWDGICSGYWDSINEGPTSGGSYGPPFTGGQCGVFYEVFIAGPNRCGNPPSSSAIALGPISGVQVVPRTGYLGGCAGPPNGSVTVEVKGAVSGGNPSGLYSAGIAHLHADDAPSWKITSVVPLSGTDNCGNTPDNEYTPPTFPPNLPPLSPPTNPAPGFGNNWDVDILPDGQVSICIGGECSTGTPPGGGGGPDSGGGPGEPDGPPQENDPNDPNDPNEITGCVGDGNILTGLRIELTDIPSGSKVTDGNYYSVCWVYMGPDSEKLDMISDGRWVYDGQFFLPDSDSCTCYKVKVRYPWGIRVQAFSRPKEE